MKQRLITITLCLLHTLITWAQTGYTDDHPLVIGMDEHYPPLQYVDKDGNLTGNDVEFTKELMKRLSIPYEFKTEGWKQLHKDVVDGKLDLVMMVYSNYRSHQVCFSNSVFSMYYEMIYKNTQSEELSLRNIKGKKVAFVMSRFIADTLLSLGADTLTVPNLSPAVAQVEAGTIDAVITFRHMTPYLISATGATHLGVSALTLMPREYCYASTDSALISLINAELANMEEDGTTDRIYGRNITSRFSTTGIPSYVYYSVAAILLILLTVAVMLRYFHNRYRESGLMFAQAGKSIAEGLCAYDTKGRLVTMNDAACEILGVTDRNGYMAAHPNIFDHPILGPMLDRKYPTQKVMMLTFSDNQLTHSPLHSHYYHIPEEKHLRVALNVARVDGKPFGYMLVLSDFTLLIATQQKLTEETEKARQAEKLKTIFMGNVSHALRTPLNAIIGFSDFLRLTPKEQIPKEEKHELLKLTNDGGHQLLYFINELIDLSNIESNGIELNPINIDIREVTEGLGEVVTPRLRHGVEFIVEHPYNECHAMLDLNVFSMVVKQLLDNAAKFTHEGYVKLTYREEGDGLRVVVEDSGEGVAKNLRSSIFNLLSNEGTFVQEGKMPGLGLSITKAIIDACNGRIGIVDDQQVGSTFWFWLPCQVTTA